MSGKKIIRGKFVGVNSITLKLVDIVVRKKGIVVNSENDICRGCLDKKKKERRVSGKESYLLVVTAGTSFIFLQSMIASVPKQKRESFVYHF